jgi:D-tyrosyl-tRNA(Tyr) deacylase
MALIGTFWSYLRMRVVLQRVSRAAVSVDGEVIGSIGPGLLLLVGIHKSDSDRNLKPMRDKIMNMRIFQNGAGKFDLSLLDVEGGALLIPQFTLFADTGKGRRPEFFDAMRPPEAATLFDKFVASWRESTISKIESGRFGAHMTVELVNDGPVTIIIDG